jgi:hypothetical protein
MPTNRARALKDIGDGARVDSARVFEIALAIRSFDRLKLSDYATRDRFDLAASDEGAIDRAFGRREARLVGVGEDEFHRAGKIDAPRVLNHGDRVAASVTAAVEKSFRRVYREAIDPAAGGARSGVFVFGDALEAGACEAGYG